MRLGQTRKLERQRAGDVMKTPGGHSDVRRHRAVDAVAESPPVRTQVVSAGAAQDALAADFGSGLADDAVAFVKMPDAASGPGDGPGELMTEHDGHVDRPRMRVVGLVHVGAAHRDGADAEQHVGVADVRNRDLAQLHRHRFERIVDDGRLDHVSCEGHEGNKGRKRSALLGTAWIRDPESQGIT